MARCRMTGLPACSVPGEGVASDPRPEPPAVSIRLCSLGFLESVDAPGARDRTGAIDDREPPCGPFKRAPSHMNLIRRHPQGGGPPNFGAPTWSLSTLFA